MPANATFDNDDESERQPLWKRATSQFCKNHTPQTTICCNYNVIKIIISLVQLVFAISTLYRTRGDQIEKYGYAAFGLAVAPYAWMSFVNLIANMICPQYDTMFLVETKALVDLRKGMHASDRPTMTSTVGRLAESSEEELDRAYLELKKVKKEAADSTFKQKLPIPDGPLKGLGTMLSLYIGAIPLAIVGALSHFRPQQSTTPQRVWVMAWLTLGAAAAGLHMGPLANLIGGPPPIARRMALNYDKSNILFGLFGLFLYGSVSIGGYVVVGQMIHEFGICSDLY